MSQPPSLSSKFNLSVGFVPVILTFISCRFTTQDLSLYIGAGAGVLLSTLALHNTEHKILQTLLYCSTGMLLLLSIASVLLPGYCPRPLFPFTLEVSALVPPFLIYFNRRHYLAYHAMRSKTGKTRLFIQGAEATVVSARVILLIGLLHLLILLAAVLISHPLQGVVRFVLLEVSPLLVFALGILFNQFGIAYFNAHAKTPLFVNYVTPEGDAIGKVPLLQALTRKTRYPIPCIRIAVSSNGMLFLAPKHDYRMMNTYKTDVLIEDYLYNDETIEDALRRTYQKMPLTVSAYEIRFLLKYHFENKDINRLVYLFTLDLAEDSILNTSNYEDGKLWTLSQIEANLGKDYFCALFEHEFQELKDFIYTRGRDKAPSSGQEVPQPSTLSQS